jgi:hypothetical protein
MSTIGIKQPGYRSRDRFVAAIFALAVPSIALADDGIICPRVPPGGSIQLKVRIIDPTPIIIDPTPIIIDPTPIIIDPTPIIVDPTPIIVDLSGPGFGAVAGVTLLGAPNTAGTAVIFGNSLVTRTVSPAATPGLSSDPMIAVTIAVPDQAPVGTTASLTLDSAAPSGLDPLGNFCMPNLVDWSMAKGAVSITDVLPGGGFLPAGSLVAVAGIGFQPQAQVLIDGVSLASTSWVDSSRIEVVTAVETQLDGRMVSVTNPDLTGATYYSYLRATDLGKSARPLLAATEAIFPVQPRSTAVFAAPTSGTFFGLALQNPEPADSIVSVDLLDAGSVVASASLALPPRTKVSREVSELFPGVIPSTGSAFELTATVPVQMLGLSGNETDGSVTPVLPALATP